MAKRKPKPTTGRDPKTGIITVMKDENDPIPPKIFQRAILDLAEGYKKFLNAGVKKETLCVLLKDQTAIPKSDIMRVLDGLESLRKDWLTV